MKETVSLHKDMHKNSFCAPPPIWKLMGITVCFLWVWL